MTIPTVLLLVALILAAIDLIRARGESLTGWAVVLICLSLLYTVIF